VDGAGFETPAKALALRLIRSRRLGADILLEAVAA
jgi:hypothetical protein